MATLVALPMGVAAASMALASGEGERHNRAQIIQVMAKTVQQTSLDLGEQGFGQGDRIVFHEELSRNGRRVGEDGGDCVVIRIQGPAFKAQCSLSFSLPDGQITGQGLATIGSGAANTLAVTGALGAISPLTERRWSSSSSQTSFVTRSRSFPEPVPLCFCTEHRADPTRRPARGSRAWESNDLPWAAKLRD